MASEFESIVHIVQDIYVRDVDLISSGEGQVLFVLPDQDVELETPRVLKEVPAPDTQEFQDYIMGGRFRNR